MSKFDLLFSGGPLLSPHHPLILRPCPLWKIKEKNGKKDKQKLKEIEREAGEYLRVGYSCLLIPLQRCNVGGL